MESNSRRHRTRIGPILRVAWLAALFAAAIPAARAQAPPAPADPAKLPAQDQHQGVLIAVDPYVTSGRSKLTFGKKHPYTAGILAVEVYVRNDSDRMVVVSPPPIEFRVAGPDETKHEIVPMTPEDTAVHLRHINPYTPVFTENPTLPGVECWGSGRERGRGRGPGRAKPGLKCIMTLPQDPRYGIWKEEKEVAKLSRILQAESLPSSVAAHSMIRGFLFYNISGQFQVVEDASLFFPDVRREEPREDLLFFEVQLGAAVN